jgi:hypothetical protein
MGVSKRNPEGKVERESPRFPLQKTLGLLSEVMKIIPQNEPFYTSPSTSKDLRITLLAID